MSGTYKYVSLLLICKCAALLILRKSECDLRGKFVEWGQLEEKIQKQWKTDTKKNAQL